jgi:hypothetical protein
MNRHYHEHESKKSKKVVDEWVDEKETELIERRKELIMDILPRKLEKDKFCDSAASPMDHYGGRKMIGELIVVNKLIKKVGRINIGSKKNARERRSKIERYQDQIIDYANQGDEMKAIVGEDTKEGMQKTLLEFASDMDDLIDQLSQFKSARAQDRCDD